MSSTLLELAESTDRLASLEDATRDERERRNKLIVRAVDEGERRADIRSHGKVSAKTICVILGEHG